MKVLIKARSGIPSSAPQGRASIILLVLLLVLGKTDPTDLKAQNPPDPPPKTTSLRMNLDDTSLTITENSHSGAFKIKPFGDLSTLTPHPDGSAISWLTENFPGVSFLTVLPGLTDHDNDPATPSIIPQDGGRLGLDFSGTTYTFRFKETTSEGRTYTLRDGDTAASTIIAEVDVPIPGTGEGDIAVETGDITAGGGYTALYLSFVGKKRVGEDQLKFSVKFDPSFAGAIDNSNFDTQRLTAIKNIVKAFTYEARDEFGAAPASRRVAIEGNFSIDTSETYTIRTSSGSLSLVTITHHRTNLRPVFGGSINPSASHSLEEDVPTDSSSPDIMTENGLIIKQYFADNGIVATAQDDQSSTEIGILITFATSEADFGGSVGAQKIGQWEYNALEGEGTVKDVWTTLPEIDIDHATDPKAFLMLPTTLIRFKRFLNENTGTLSAVTDLPRISYVLWDRSGSFARPRDQVTGIVLKNGEVSAAEAKVELAVGPTSSLSAPGTTRTEYVRVIPVEDRPVLQATLDPEASEIDLAPVTEDVASDDNAGTQLSTLLGITDVDAANHNPGDDDEKRLRVDVVTDAGFGTWQYRNDAADEWTEPSSRVAARRYIDLEGYLRFQPDPNRFTTDTSPEVPVIFLRAWDGDESSVESITLRTSVSPVNDPPSLILNEFYRAGGLGRQSLKDHLNLISHSGNELRFRRTQSQITNQPLAFTWRGQANPYPTTLSRNVLEFSPFVLSGGVGEDDQGVNLEISWEALTYDKDGKTETGGSNPLSQSEALKLLEIASFPAGSYQTLVQGFQQEAGKTFRYHYHPTVEGTFKISLSAVDVEDSKYGSGSLRSDPFEIYMEVVDDLPPTAPSSLNTAATGVSVSSQDANFLYYSFDEYIELVDPLPTETVKIYEFDPVSQTVGDDHIYSIPWNEMALEVDSDQPNRLKLNLATVRGSLVKGTSYRIYLPASLVQDQAAANNVLRVPIGGSGSSSANANWDFSTQANTSSPNLIHQEPEDDDTGTAVGEPMVFVYDEDMELNLDDNATAFTVTLKRGGQTVHTQTFKAKADHVYLAVFKDSDYKKSQEGNVLTLDPFPLNGSEYYPDNTLVEVVIEGNLIRGKGETDYLSGSSLSFTTGTRPVPTLLSPTEFTSAYDHSDQSTYISAVPSSGKLKFQFVSEVTFPSGPGDEEVSVVLIKAIPNHNCGQAPEETNLNDLKTVYDLKREDMQSAAAQGYETMANIKFGLGYYKIELLEGAGLEQNGDGTAPFVAEGCISAGDTSPPQVISYSPEHSGTGVGLTPTLKIEFDEPISLDDQSVFSLYKVEVGDDSKLLAGDDAQISITRDPENIRYILINLSSLQTPLHGLNEYYVNYTEDFISDFSNNKVAALSGDASWRFTTQADTSAPYAVELKSSGGYEGGNTYVRTQGGALSFTLKFSERLVKSGTTGHLDVVPDPVVSGKDLEIPLAQINLSDSGYELEFLITPSTLLPSTTYRIKWASGGFPIEDLSQNEIALSNQDQAARTFTTEGAPPTLPEHDPNNIGTFTTDDENHQVHVVNLENDINPTTERVFSGLSHSYGQSLYLVWFDDPGKAASYSPSDTDGFLHRGATFPTIENLGFPSAPIPISEKYMGIYPFWLRQYGNQIKGPPIRVVLVILGGDGIKLWPLNKPENVLGAEEYIPTSAAHTLSFDMISAPDLQVPPPTETDLPSPHYTFRSYEYEISWSGVGVTSTQENRPYSTQRTYIISDPAEIGLDENTRSKQVKVTLEVENTSTGDSFEVERVLNVSSNESFPMQLQIRDDAQADGTDEAEYFCLGSGELPLRNHLDALAHGTDIRSSIGGLLATREGKWYLDSDLDGLNAGSYDFSRFSRVGQGVWYPSGLATIRAYLPPRVVVESLAGVKYCSQDQQPRFISLTVGGTALRSSSDTNSANRPQGKVQVYTSPTADGTPSTYLEDQAAEDFSFVPKDIFDDYLSNNPAATEVHVTIEYDSHTSEDTNKCHASGKATFIIYANPAAPSFADRTADGIYCQDNTQVSRVITVNNSQTGDILSWYTDRGLSQGSVLYNGTDNTFDPPSTSPVMSTEDGYLKVQRHYATITRHRSEFFNGCVGEYSFIDTKIAAKPKLTESLFELDGEELGTPICIDLDGVELGSNILSEAEDKLRYNSGKLILRYKFPEIENYIGSTRPAGSDDDNFDDEDRRAGLGLSRNYEDAYEEAFGPHGQEEEVDKGQNPAAEIPKRNLNILSLLQLFGEAEKSAYSLITQLDKEDFGDTSAIPRTPNDLNRRYNLNLLIEVEDELDDGTLCSNELQVSRAIQINPLPRLQIESFETRYCSDSPPVALSVSIDSRLGTIERRSPWTNAQGWGSFTLIHLPASEHEIEIPFSTVFRTTLDIDAVIVQTRALTTPPLAQDFSTAHYRIVYENDAGQARTDCLNEISQDFSILGPPPSPEVVHNNPNGTLYCQGASRVHRLNVDKDLNDDGTEDANRRGRYTWYAALAGDPTKADKSASLSTEDLFQPPIALATAVAGNNVAEHYFHVIFTRDADNNGFAGCESESTQIKIEVVGRPEIEIAAPAGICVGTIGGNGNDRTREENVQNNVELYAIRTLDGSYQATGIGLARSQETGLSGNVSGHSSREKIATLRFSPLLSVRESQRNSSLQVNGLFPTQSRNIEFTYTNRYSVGPYNVSCSSEDRQTLSIYQLPVLSISGPADVFTTGTGEELEVCADRAEFTVTGAPSLGDGNRQMIVDASGASGLQTTTNTALFRPDVLRASDAGVNLSTEEKNVLKAQTRAYTSRAESQYYVFAPESEHKITYLYEDPQGCTNFITKTIKVNSLPLVSIGTEFACQEDDVLITPLLRNRQELGQSGYVSKYEWDFGDNMQKTVLLGQGETASVQHFYQESGVYKIAVSAETNEGCRGASERNLTLGQIPNPQLYWSGIVEGKPTYFHIRDGNATDEQAVLRTKSIVLEIRKEGKALEGFRVERTRVDTNGDQRINDLDDPIEDPFADVPFTFQEPGNYQVELEITSVYGCLRKTLREFSILPHIVVTEAGYSTSFERETNWLAHRTYDLEPEEDDRFSAEERPNSWTWGIPGGDAIDRASDGEKAWVTNLAGEYKKNESSWVYTPEFDISRLSRPMISFDLIYEFDSRRDGAVLQYSLDGGSQWIVLGNYREGQSTGLNWYRHELISSDPGQQAELTAVEYKTANVGWSEVVDQGEWQHLRHKLDVIPPEKRENIRFRFAIATDAEGESEGIGVDNFSITNRKRRVFLEEFASELSEESGKFHSDIANYIDSRSLSGEKNLLINTEDIIHVSYYVQPRELSGIDRLFQASPGDFTARSLFYGVGTVPYALLNGGVSLSQGREIDAVIEENNIPWTENDLNLQALYEAKISLEIELLDSHSSEISFKVDAIPNPAIGDILLGEHRVYVLLVEASVDIEGKNGLKGYKNVVRKIMPNGAGIPFDFDGIKARYSHIMGWEISSGVISDFNQLSGIALIQSVSTKEVYQVETIEVKGKRPLSRSISHEFIEEEEYLIYPNPAADYINIRAPQKINLRSHHIRIYDMTGKIVQEILVEKDVQNSRLLIGDDLPSGTYYLSISRDQKPVLLRKIILRTGN
ncbi:MAG: Ig-like domain-containing protein [Cytophagales bacterium]|nr:Ig-like domain-containing protein [Cytophagales bacterium]